MRALVIRWACNVAALFVAAWALAGVDYGDKWWTLLVAALVFTAVNMAIKPVLAVLSIPFIVVTLGLAYFLLNVLMLYLTDWLVKGFDITSFGSAVLAAIIVSLVNFLLHRILREHDR